MDNQAVKATKTKQSEQLLQAMALAHKNSHELLHKVCETGRRIGADIDNENKAVEPKPDKALSFMTEATTTMKNIHATLEEIDRAMNVINEVF